MPVAVKRGGDLVAPTVGTWRPAVARGAPLTPGQVLGTLERAGRWVPVEAPRGVGGIAVRVRPAGSWVAFGETLVEAGEGVLGAVTEEAVVDADAPPPGITVVRAETDGTVYLRPEPGAPPFAALGAEVSAHQTVALVEVMKTFHPARTPIAGAVERVLVDDGAAITADAPLLWIATLPS